MTGLPVKKIYIDTRFKTNDSTSNSDFRFQLFKSVFLPKDSTFVIDDVNIPHSWNTIETGVNDRFYVAWRLLETDTMNYNIIMIPSGRYSGSELATWFRSGINALGTGQWTVVYTSANKITFTTNNVANFKIYTDDELTAMSGPGGFVGMDPYNKMTVNEILQIYGNQTGVYAGTGKPFTTGFLNMITHQDLYLTSASLGSFDAMGARGESSVIRKIPVNASWGSSIIDKLSDADDSMSCSKLSLTTIDFQIRGVRGNVVPLNGGHVSFTIRFKEN